MWLFGRKRPAGSGFSASSTAEEVPQGIDGTGLTAIVTGASSGIGAETTRVLALHGVHVIMGVRNMAAGKDVKETIVTEIPAAKVDAMELASVRKCASEYNSQGRPLNILMNYGKPFMLSTDNIELQFATNYLVTAVLVHMVNRSLHANELAKRLKEDGETITANSLHPGSIGTNLFRYNGILQGFSKTVGKLVLKNIPQGAATTCYVALHPQVQGVTGEYFLNSNIAKTTAQGQNVELAKRLWDFSMNWVN